MLRHNAASKGLARGGDDSTDAGALCEHDFEFFEAAAHGLWVAKVDDGEDECRDDEENEVVFPANGFDGDLVSVSVLRVEMNRGEGMTRTGVTMLTTKFHSQWFAVEIPAMGTRSRVGATSVQ